jgi:hypothetical protein
MQLIVSWTAPASIGRGIANYRAVASPGGAACATSTDLQNTCMIGGLTTGTAYTVTVVAVGVDGVDSPASLPSTATIPTDGPTIGSTVRNADGRLVMVARGTNGQLYFNIQNIVGRDTWAGWVSLGGTLTTNPIAVRNADGRIQVFAYGPGGTILYKIQTTPGSTTWSPTFTSVGGGQLRSPSLAIQFEADGRVHIFGRGIDNALWHTVQLTPGSVGWTGFQTLGGTLTGEPTVQRSPDGRLDVFVRGADLATWHRTEATPGSSIWTPWTSIGGGLVSAPSRRGPDLSAAPTSDRWRAGYLVRRRGD